MYNKAILKRLRQIVHQAQIRIDLDTAQNPDLQRAIKIVETFLRKSRRVCYGGQAINVQLPQKDQFYNLETSLPDYDFFSPDDKEDVRGLIEDLKAAGFTEISKRVGIHEGTTKIYVNYVAIADITKIDEGFYDQINRKSVTVDGIHYADPVFLRMMMFLELSRPKGMLSRWEKVYERLDLLDKAHPLKSCSSSVNLAVTESREAASARAAALRYIIKNHRVFMGADISSIYKSGTASSRTKFLLHGRSPVVFFSPDANFDADALLVDLRGVKEEIVGFQNILPAMIGLYRDGQLVCLIVQEEACHSFLSIPLTKQRILRVASLDTLLTFLIGLYYRDDHILFGSDSLLCWLNQYMKLLDRYRAKPSALVPSFSVECSGYQTSFASLLRAKGARIEAERQRIGSGQRSERSERSESSGSTRKIFRNSLRKTRRLTTI
jgi:hypothetical protein